MIWSFYKLSIWKVAVKYKTYKISSWNVAEKKCKVAENLSTAEFIDTWIKKDIVLKYT